LKRLNLTTESQRRNKYFFLQNNLSYQNYLMGFFYIFTFDSKFIKRTFNKTFENMLVSIKLKKKLRQTLKMKLKIFMLLFPIFLFGQENNENLMEIKAIKSQIKFADSISNFIQEEIKNSVVIPSHGRIDGKQTESTKIQTRILKHSNQILRICFVQSNLKENWIYYYFNSKLIYAESHKLLGKKKIIKKKFYFQNDILISPLFSDRNYDVEEEVNVLIKANELLKSNL